MELVEQLKAGINTSMKMLRGDPKAQLYNYGLQEMRSRLRPEWLRKIGCLAIPLVVISDVLINLRERGFEHIPPTFCAGLLAFGFPLILKPKNDSSKKQIR